MRCGKQDSSDPLLNVLAARVSERDAQNAQTPADSRW